VPRYLGGIETQLVVLAKGLAKEGCDVSLITYDHGQPDGERFQGVTVYKSHAPDIGVPMIRFFHPRSTQLWRAMRRSNADIFLQMGAGTETGQVAFGCRLLPSPRRKFVFCMASDTDFGRYPKEGAERKIFRRPDHCADRPSERWSPASHRIDFRRDPNGCRATLRPVGFRAKRTIKSRPVGRPHHG
jgi:hypothetical protein